jgi:hypothetical protein
LGSLRIVPGWDGRFQIQRLGYDLNAMSLGIRRYGWEEVVSGFESREAAMARIEFMGRQQDLVTNDSRGER